MNLTKENIEDIYPASYLQAGMLLESSLNNTGTYHDVFFYKIAEKFDCILFMHIWDQLIAKHELLRSRFISDKNGWVNVIEKSVSKICSVYYAEDLEQIINTERLNNIDYEKPGLFRLIINDLPDNQFYLIFSFHHAIADGWSVASLINEFIQAYSYNKPILNNINLYYGEFVRNEQLATTDTTKIKFWDKYLLNIDIPRKIKWNFKLETSSNSIFKSQIELSSTDCKQIHKIAQANKVSIDSIFLYAYIKTLAQFLSQDDITIGLVVNNRLEKEYGDQLLGLFLNTIPYRLNLKSIKNNVDGISKSYIEKIKLYEYKLVPYGHIKSIFKNDLFQFAFNFVNFHVLNDSATAIVNCGGYERTNIPFVLNIVQDSKNTFSINFVAHDDIVDQEYLNYFAEYLKHNLKHVIWHQSDNYVGLPKKDYQKIIYDWNQTDRKCPGDKTIQQLFEEQVTKTPNNIAIVYEATKLTYNELNQKSNQLAHYLRDKYQIKADTLIALCLDRNEHMLIAILAVLKSGAAYVPIEPTYPTGRIHYILEDTQAKVVLTNIIYKSLFAKVVSTPTLSHGKIHNMCIMIDSVKFVSSLSKYSSKNLIQSVTNKNLAYVIYTSGTSGLPKGVMVEHIGIINTVIVLGIVYNLNFGSRISAFTSYVFDVFTAEILTALLNGAELYLLSDSVRFDTTALSNYLLENKINYAYLPPIILSNLPKLNFPNLRGLIYAGEPCHKDTAHYWSNKVRLYNYYGPTETSIYVIGKQITCNETHLIGRPIANTQAYILDNHLQPLPIGVIGTLYIAGVGVARGYLNKLDLTKKCFIHNPFQNNHRKTQNIRSKLYNTGDLARYLPDGNIEYIGRNDLQVKIRGFRIELGEIENNLSSYIGIKQSVVLVKNHVDTDGVVAENKYLIGYYVADNELDEELIRAHLKEKLPEYMIPNMLVWLKKLPLTINGKFDKNAVPKVDFIRAKNYYVAPSNSVETGVCADFAKILGISVDNVGLTDDFFRLGGNSILAIRLLYALRSKFKINLNNIFELKTPAKIIKYCSQVEDILHHNIMQVACSYKILSSYKKERILTMEKKKSTYLQQTKQIKINKIIKNIHNVLLTGVTGHLGCHILYQLLYNTRYVIYLPVRAASDVEAYNRANTKFKFYFDIELDKYRERIITFAADIEKFNFNLNIEQYQMLASNVDSIIHSAATTKHYGAYSTYYQANVQTTINLLELAKSTTLKDFHYISTLSTLTDGYVPNSHRHIFIEDDNRLILEGNTNVYSQTKHEGELATVKYREFGIKSNIYRLGNLLMNSKNYRIQENIEENAFFTCIKTVLNVGMLPKEMAKVEISPVDCAALAIVKLFDKTSLSNSTYHISNPNICDLHKIFKSFTSINVKLVYFDKFVANLLTYFKNVPNCEEIKLFMLHQHWFDDINLKKLTHITILQNRTDYILQQLDFTWPLITSNMVYNIINIIDGARKNE